MLITFYHYSLEPSLTCQLVLFYYYSLASGGLATLVLLTPSLPMKYTVISALVFSLKFLVLIALMVFVRGGIPRYRYDFLTKIGWIKFLSLVLAVFLSTLLLLFLV
jgi:NADH:ubiquinone oxidoreductase subunit H